MRHTKASICAHVMQRIGYPRSVKMTKRDKRIDDVFTKRELLLVKSFVDVTISNLTEAKEGIVKNAKKKRTKRRR